MLSAKVLRLANSVVLRRPAVDGVDRRRRRADRHPGAQPADRRLRRVVVVRGRSRASTCATFWRDSLIAATAANKLAPRLQADAEEAYACGLLHGTGHLILCQTYPDIANVDVQRLRGRCAAPSSRRSRRTRSASTIRRSARSGSRRIGFPQAVADTIRKSPQPLADERRAARPRPAQRLPAGGGGRAARTSAETAPGRAAAARRGAARRRRRPARRRLRQALRGAAGNRADDVGRASPVDRGAPVRMIAASRRHPPPRRGPMPSLRTPPLSILAFIAAALACAAQPAAAQPTPLERGRYLVTTILACGNCHTPKDAEGRADPGPGARRRRRRLRHPALRRRRLEHHARSRHRHRCLERRRDQARHQPRRAPGARPARRQAAGRADGGQFLQGDAAERSRRGRRLPPLVAAGAQCLAGAGVPRPGRSARRSPSPIAASARPT